MKSLATFGAACAIGLAAMSGAAQADIYHFTVTGKIGSGFDTRGLFGADGADMTGKSYSATLTFDPALLEFNPVSGPPVDTRLYIGDTGIFEIKIDGASHSFNAGGPYQFAFVKADADPATTGGWRYAAIGTLTGATGDVGMGLLSATNFMGSLDLTTLQSYTVTPQDLAFTGEPVNVWDGGDFRFVFTPETISLTSEPGTLAQGVPEPASWALMIVGFGGAGVMLRGRRRSAFAA